MTTPEPRFEAAFMLKQLVELSDALRRRRTSASDGRISHLLHDSRVSFEMTEESVGLELAARRAGGESYAAIAIDLNRRGLRGRYGGRWYTSSVRALLQRGRAKEIQE